jgi:hypothetical protein
VKVVRFVRIAQVVRIARQTPSSRRGGRLDRLNAAFPFRVLAR